MFFQILEYFCSLQLYLWFVYFLYFLKRLAILSKAVQFNLEEVKECRQKVKELERRYEQLTKDNYDLKESVRLSVHFAEVLPREDLEERKQMWPQIEQASKTDLFLRSSWIH